LNWALNRRDKILQTPRSTNCDFLNSNSKEYLSFLFSEWVIDTYMNDNLILICKLWILVDGRLYDIFQESCSWFIISCILLLQFEWTELTVFYSIEILTNLLEPLFHMEFGYVNNLIFKPFIGWFLEYLLNICIGWDKCWILANEFQFLLVCLGLLFIFYLVIDNPF